jgi:hypothetical protein
MSDLKVFISYGGSDAPWAERFSRHLESRGVDAWLSPEEIALGDPLVTAMEKALRESDVLVALVSPENVERPDFNFEIGAALGLGKQIVSVVPRGFDDAMLPRFLPRRRRLVKQTPEKTADELLSKAA